MIPQLLIRMAVGAIFGASAWTLATNQPQREPVQQPIRAPAPAGNGNPPAPTPERKERVYH